MGVRRVVHRVSGSYCGDRQELDEFQMMPRCGHKENGNSCAPDKLRGTKGRRKSDPEQEVKLQDEKVLNCATVRTVITGWGGVQSGNTVRATILRTVACLRMSPSSGSPPLPQTLVFFVINNPSVGFIRSVQYIKHGSLPYTAT